MRKRFKDLLHVLLIIIGIVEMLIGWWTLMHVWGYL